MALIHQPYQISFTAETTIYENEVQCNVNENDFNYTQNPTAATLQRDAAPATAVLYITQITAGYNYIEVYVDDPDYGVVFLNNYTQTAADTTITILAANIAAALNQNSYGYVVTSEGNQVLIQARAGLGIAMNEAAVIVTNSTYLIFDTTFDNTFN